MERGLERGKLRDFRRIAEVRIERLFDPVQARLHFRDRAVDRELLLGAPRHGVDERQAQSDVRVVFSECSSAQSRKHYARLGVEFRRQARVVVHRVFDHQQRGRDLHPDGLAHLGRIGHQVSGDHREFARQFVQFGAAQRPRLFLDGIGVPGEDCERRLGTRSKPVPCILGAADFLAQCDCLRHALRLVGLALGRRQAALQPESLLGVAYPFTWAPVARRRLRDPVKQFAHQALGNRGRAFDHPAHLLLDL